MRCFAGMSSYAFSSCAVTLRLPFRKPRTRRTAWLLTMALSVPSVCWVYSLRARPITIPGSPLASPAWAVAFSPNGRTLAVTTTGADVVLWDVVAHRSVGRIQQAGTVYGFTSDGRAMCSVDHRSGTANLWAVPSGVREWVLREHGLQQPGRAPTRSGNVAFDSWTGTLAIATAQHLEIHHMSEGSRGIALPQSSRAYLPRFLRDGGIVALKHGTSDWDDHGVEGQDWVVWRRTSRGDWHRSAARGWWITLSIADLSAANNTLVVGGSEHDEGQADIWSLNPPAPAFEIHAPWEVRRVAVSSNGRLVATAARNGSVKVWDVSTWREVAELQGEWQDIYSLTFSPDSSHVAAAGMADKSMARIWALPPQCRESAPRRDRNR